MRDGIFATPRAVPSRTLPALGAGLVLALALVVFLIAGWEVRGWALGAVLWVGLEAVELLLGRLRGSTGDNLGASAVLAFGLTFKAVVVLAVLFATAVSHPRLALAAALVYLLAYTFQLGLALTAYFGVAR